MIADLRATIAELSAEVRREISQRLAELKDGAPGASGPPGPPGPVGKLPIVKIFEPDKVYYEGDVVIRNGSTFQARRDTGHSVSHPD